MTLAPPLAPPAREADLTTEVLELLAERTKGWSADKKAALTLELRRWTYLQKYRTPLVLAEALEPDLHERPPHLALIDEACADVEAGATDRLMISLGSQHGKSETAVVWNCVWRLWRNPDLRITIASYELGLARDMASRIRDIITQHGQDAGLVGHVDKLGLRVERGKHAAGNWRIEGHRGGVYAVGTRGALTGRAVDLLILDDPMKGWEQADSEQNREQVWNFWTGTARTRLGAKSQVIVIGTRWHEDDTIGRLQTFDEILPPERRQWRIINIPIIAGDNDPLGRQPGAYLEHDVRGRGPADYDLLRQDVGERVWAAVYQGNPTPAEGGVFKWDWIRPHRLLEAPELRHVVVAVDTTGGGHDEAGIIGGGRAANRRTYVTADRSGRYTAGAQWRHAWFTVLDLEADVLVYEKNLVDPIMRKAIPAAWQRMRDQAKALADANLLGVDLADVDERIYARRMIAAARSLAGQGDDDTVTADDPQAALVAQLEELMPYAARILDAPDFGPARVEGVAATRGKRIRAEPVSQAYETGQVSHVGVFPALEQELVTWQEGQDSPNRLDALVWLVTYLAVGSTPGKVSTAGGGARVPTGAASVARPEGRRRA